MAIKEFDQLSDDERDLILRAPALVSVLIAGADRSIDQREIMHAIKAVHYRSITEGDFLHRYFEAVDENFESECHHLIQKYEGRADDRESYITGELTGLNDILPKIDKRYAGDLLKSLKSLARSVAKSSGGFLGFERISLEESHFIDLKMITYQG